jgi:pyridoxal biosynthesis lyase PdxS
MHNHTVMIRAREETRDALREIADASGTTAIEALDRIVSDAREAGLLAALSSSLTTGADDIANETRELDAVAGDGLKPADDFADW